jgi:hypothetical protein
LTDQNFSSTIVDNQLSTWGDQVMLLQIPNEHSPWISVIADDPVRPNIPANVRVGPMGRVLVLLDEQDEPEAVVCMSLMNHVPTDESELFQQGVINPQVAVLYSIWSQKQGGGSRLVKKIPGWVKTHLPTVNQLVTLSPLTHMARKFHTSHGATVWRHNPTSINFRYELD